jgi:hypothetical protein
MGFLKIQQLNGILTLYIKRVFVAADALLF